MIPSTVKVVIKKRLEIIPVQKYMGKNVHEKQYSIMATISPFPKWPRFAAKKWPSWRIVSSQTINQLAQGFKNNSSKIIEAKLLAI